MGNAKIVNRNCYRVCIAWYKRERVLGRGWGWGGGGGGVVGSVALKHVLPDPLKGQYTFTSLPFENKRPYFIAPASFSMQN